MWEQFACFCTDGALAMLGSRSGLTTLVKKNHSVFTTHYVIYRQVLAYKTSEEFVYTRTLKQAVKMVNTIKATLNIRF